MSGKVVAYAALVCTLCGGLFAAAEPASVPGNHSSLKGGAMRGRGAAVQPAARQKPAWPPQRPSRERPASHSRNPVHRGGRMGDAFMVDTGVVYVPSSNSQYSCGAASNGNGWRVMWWNDYDGNTYTSGIGQDGSVLDGAGQMVEGQGAYGSFGTHSIVGTGSGFIAVWPQSYYGSIWASRLDSTGTSVDSFLVYEDGYEQAEPAIAFDGDSTCLVVWTENPYESSDIYGIRVTTGGRVLDQQPIPVANQSAQDEMMPVVAFGQGVYLVVWTSYNQGWFNRATARAVRVSADGVVLDTAVFLHHDAGSMQAYPAVAFGDTCFLVSWSEGIEQPDMYAQRLSASGALLDTAAVQLSSGPDYDLAPSIGFTGNRYLVMWEEDDPTGNISTLCGRRMTSDGMPLDTGLIRWGIDGYDCQSPSVSADQANFLVALTTYDTAAYRQGVCCVRIGPDGAVLDTGILFGLTADAQYYPSGASGGNQFLASWLESRATGSVVSAARISDNGQVLDPAGFLVNGAPGQKSSLSTAFGDSVYLVAWDAYRGDGFPRDIYCARVSLDGSVLDTAGILVCRESLYRYLPDISSDGQNFLVVWTDSRSQVTSSIYAARVSTGGVVLDPNGFAVAAADTFDDGQPAVCFTGTDYLVVWPGMNTNTYESRVHGALVSPAGRIAKPRFVVGGAEDYQNSPSVARGPTNLLVAWEDARSYPTTIYAARVRADGAVLDPNGVRVDTADGDHSPHVTADEAGFQVIWSRLDYSSDTTTFTVAQIDPAGRIIREGDWYRLPGPDNGFDAVSGSGPDLLLLFSCWTDTALGRSYGTERLWARLGQVTGAEQADKRQLRDMTGGTTVVRGVLLLPRSLDPSISRSLLDISGRKVLNLVPGANDVSRLAPGVYFVREEAQAQAQAQEIRKIVVAR
jgi:hypothetical protein